MRIAVVGSGIAGHEAALAARREDPGAQITVVTRDSEPLYSACVLADYVAGEIPREALFLEDRGEWGRQGIDVLRGDATTWAPQERTLRVGELDLAYDRLVLATGSRPFVPPVPGADRRGVHTLKTPADADRLRAAQGTSAVVVGTGPVGIEAAVALRRRGWSVTLVELLDRVSPRLFDAPLAEALRGGLEAGGIGVLLGEKVLELAGEGNVEAVRTDRRVLPADLVVLVVGMRPDVELARAGGILGPSGGVAVDEGLATGVPGVWACGDCAETNDLATGRLGLHMLWNNAKRQGRVAGANAAGADRRYAGSLNVTTVGLFGEAHACVGVLAADVPDGEARVLHRRGSGGELWLVLREGRLVGVQARGHTERVGGLLGLILRRVDLQRALRRGPRGAGGRDVWALEGVRRELDDLLAD